MTRGVLDAGVVIGFLQGRQAALARVQRLFESSRAGSAELVVSVVNLAEILRHTAQLTRETGLDVLAVLRAYRVAIHHPDEAIAHRVAKLPTSIADGFAAATALELQACLHTTDAELVSQLRRLRLTVTQY